MTPAAARDLGLESLRRAVIAEAVGCRLKHAKGLLVCLGLGRISAADGKRHCHATARRRRRCLHSHTPAQDDQVSEGD